MKTPLILLTSLFCLAASAQEVDRSDPFAPSTEAMKGREKVEYFRTPAEKEYLEKYRQALTLKDSRTPDGVYVNIPQLRILSASWWPAYSEKHPDQPYVIWFKIGRIVDSKTALVNWGKTTQADSSLLKEKQESGIAAILNLPEGVKVGDIFARVVYPEPNRYVWNGTGILKFNAVEPDNFEYFEPKPAKVSK